MEPVQSPNQQQAPGLQAHRHRLFQDEPSPSVVWIDDAQLSRDCIARAVGAALPHLHLHVVGSLEDCLADDRSHVEPVVFYAHSGNAVDLDAIEAVRSAYSHARLIILSDASNLSTVAVREVLSSGVAGFILTRQTSLQMVISAINLVHSGGTFVPREFLFAEEDDETKGMPVRSSDGVKLTQREIEVLELLREGSPNKRIAQELAMSASTVKVHVRNIMHKLGAANRTQVALGAATFLRDGLAE